MNQTVLEARHISKSFREQMAVPVLHDISFTVEKGEFVSMMGRSGCGKSTLLYILSTMDTDYEGELFIDGEKMTGEKPSRLARIRNEKIGFVFQFHYLLNEFSVLQNVLLPGLKKNELTEKELTEKAVRWLEVLGIASFSGKLPHQLSGGEKQRVAIARALINDPLIIMGDEPTGNLDSKNSQTVFAIFKKLCEEFDQTLLVVTHDPEFARHTHRNIEMEDGRITGHAFPSPAKFIP